MALSITNNVASLTAQHNLNRTSNALAKSLERLSSGLKINRGADGPAALVISEQQRAQIAGLQTAVDNTSKAVSLVQTGEGALNEINALLVKVRGLALDSANSGVNDSNALAANQAEIKNALQSIDRIANTTQFGTKKLLDGTSAATAVLGTTGSTNISSVTAGSSTVAGTYEIAVSQQGQKAQLVGSNAFAAATNTATTSAGTAISGSATISSTLTQTGTYNVTVTQQGVKGNVTAGGAGATAAVAGSTANNLTVAGGALTGTVNVTIANGDTLGTTVTNIQTQLDANAAGAGHYVVSQSGGIITIKAAAFGAEASALTVTAATAFAAAASGFSNATPTAGTQGSAVQAQISGGNLSSPISVTGSGANGDTINVTAGISSIAQGLNFTAFSSGNSTAAVGATGSVTVTGNANLTLGTGSSAITLNLNAQNSNTIDNLVSALNANSTTTGVTASKNGGGTNLVLTANKFGGSNFAFSATGASSGVVSNQAFTLNSQDLQAKIYDAGGTQIGTTVTAAGSNGDVITATSSATVSFGNADGLSFKLAGLGTSSGVAGIQTAAVPAAGQYTASVALTDALVFQIGANQSQTAAVSIQKVTSDQIGKNVGGLTNSATDSLSKIDVTSSVGAQDSLAIIDKAINDITSLRGKLGAFQKNTLESTANNLRTTLENTVAAESVIRDTDFAAETANFTKNQVLIQAGTTVLANANATSQLVLSLLKG